MQLNITLHCIQLEVHTHSQRFYAWLTRHLKSVAQPQGFWDTSPKITLYLEEIDSPDALPIEPLPEASLLMAFGLGYAPCSFFEGRFYASRQDERCQVIEYDTQTSTLKANLGGVFTNDETAFIYLLQCSLLRNFMITLHGLVRVHSAALHKQGRTILLIGNAGAGKSTTCLALLEAGYAFLSDDSPLLGIHQGIPQVLCSPDGPRVSRQTLDLLPQFQHAISLPPDGYGKSKIARENLPSDTCAIGPYVVSDIIQLDRGDYTAPRLLPAQKSAILHDILNQSMIFFPHSELHQPQYPFNRATRFAFDTLCRTVNQANPHRLEYNNHHLFQLPAYLDKALIL